MEHVFVPSLGGGMNQDDSLITPSKDNAGRSLFETGDYRYARNARASFRDLENLIATKQVETESLLTFEQVFENFNFEGTISPWLQLDDGPGYTAWAYDGFGGARCIFASPGSSQILYQNLSDLLVGSTFNIKIFYTGATVFGAGGLNVVFLNGTDIISEETILTGTVPTLRKALLNVDVTIPPSCTGIGIRIQDASSSGLTLHYVKGFAATDVAYPSGTEKIVGKYEDREFLKLYYAVWNSDGNHSLRYYDYTTDKIYSLLPWTGLNFEENRLVSMAKLDNWLCFTDRLNNPRLVDVTTITQLYFSLGDDFREFHITLHKWAPSAPPIPRAYYDNVTNNYDKFKGKTWQFSYRYVYNGNLKSRWSPISKAAVFAGSSGDYYTARTITSIELHIPGCILDIPGADVEYNYFGHDDVKFTEAVDYIEIAFRDGELELWKLWKRIYATSGTGFDLYHYFTAEYDGRPVNDDDFNQIFDTVPFLAGVVEAIDNRFVFADCLDEQDPVSDFRVEDIAIVDDPPFDWRSSSTNSWGTSGFSAAVRARLQRFNSLSNFNLKARAKYKLGIQFGHHSGWRSLAYTQDDWIYEIGPEGQYTLNGLTFSIPEGIIPPEWASWYQIVRTNAVGIDYFMIGIANTFIPLLDNASQLIGLSGLPESIKNKLAQHFENSNIVNGYEVQKKIEKEENKLSKVRAFAESVRSGSSSSFLKNSINNQKQLKAYLKTNPLFNKIGPEVRSSTQDVVANASRIYIDINNWYNAAKETNTKNRTQSRMYYNYRQGDRVRFFASTSANPTSNQIQVYDEEIIEFTGTGIIINKPAGVLSIPNAADFDYVTSYDIEVYTPKVPEEEDFIFYETGEWYPVLYPGTANRDFSKRDWAYDDNSSVTLSTKGPFEIFNKMPFYYGDCFNVSKQVYRDLMIVPSGVGVSMNPDPDKIYDYWERNNGRPSVSYYDLPVKKFKPTQLRFGGKVIEESSINAINRFREEDQFVYPSEYGRVRALVNTSNAQVESVGSILLAIGEREAWSIYVNRTTLEDLGGRTQFILSSTLLGSYNTLLGSHGTLNPESVTADRGRVWYWDVLNGCWVRYGRDGLTAISDYKMRDWFQELAVLILNKYQTSEIPRVTSGYDPIKDELVTRIEHSSLPATFRGYSSYKGCVFSEADTRWKFVVDYSGEFFSKIGTQFLSLKDGSIYKHEKDTDVAFGTFYGTKYDSYIEPVFNLSPMAMKVWESINVKATDGWSVERILSEYRGAKTKQESIIPLASFVPKEDSFYASIKNDLNSPNVGSSPLIEGKKMRSKAIQVLLKLDPSVAILSLLHYVIVNSIDSPKNN